jgi:hypothetical protein
MAKNSLTIALDITHHIIVTAQVVTSAIPNARNIKTIAG